MIYEFKIFIDGNIVETLRLLFHAKNSIHEDNESSVMIELLEQSIEIGVVKKYTDRLGEDTYHLTKLGKELLFETPLIGKVTIQKEEA